MANETPEWKLPFKNDPPDIGYDDKTSLQVNLPPNRLGKNERGALYPTIPLGWFDGTGSMLNIPRSINEEMIRTTLLFFDRFDVPRDEGFGMADPHIELLQSLGVLQKTYVKINGSLGIGLSGISISAYQSLNEREPGLWSISESPEALGIPARAKPAESCFQLALYDALPVFAREVPYDDVLEFKRRRFDQLLAMRTYMSELTLEVATNGAIGLAENVIFSRFDRAMADHMKVMRESNAKKVLMSVAANIDEKALIPGAVQFVANHTIDAWAAAGAAAVVAFKSIKSLTGSGGANKPFEFLAKVSRELY